jgi:uncharacterized alpha-E superfamily protein
LQAVLEIADSSMTYRRRYFAAPRLAEVIELLLRDESNPRALAFQVHELRRQAGLLPLAPNANGMPVAERRMDSLLEVLSARLPAASHDREPDRPGRPLVEWLDSLSSELGTFSDELTGRYFSHTVPRVR